MKDGRMNLGEKKKLIILIAVMVILVGGASLLYAKLGDRVETPGLVVQESSGDETVENGETENGQVNVEVSDAGGASEENHGAQEPAPDFTIYDAEGNPHKLSDFRGKPVVVNFWASWCGPCKSEMPDFQEIYDIYGEEIHFLMINMTDGAQETLESASSYIRGNGYTFPVYYDLDMDAVYTYGVFSIPTTYFFDAEGYGIAYGQGAMDKETILKGIQMIQP